METLTKEQIAKTVADILQPAGREEEIDLTPLDAEVEMAWFALEGIANQFYVAKGLPIRFKFIQATPDLMEIRHKEFIVAVYCRSLRKLYRAHDSLQLHWRMVSRAISNVFPDTIIGAE